MNERDKYKQKRHNGYKVDRHAIKSSRPTHNPSPLLKKKKSTPITKKPETAKIHHQSEKHSYLSTVQTKDPSKKERAGKGKKIHTPTTIKDFKNMAHPAHAQTRTPASHRYTPSTKTSSVWSNSNPLASSKKSQLHRCSGLRVRVEEKKRMIKASSQGSNVFI